MRKTIAFWIVTCVLPLAAADPTFAQDRADKSRPALRVGDQVPQFDGLEAGGQHWNSADYVGKQLLVVYFYPADFQRTAERQARRFNDEWKELRDRGVELVGISGDSVATHRLFKQHNKLDFTLLSDETGAIAKKLGVPTRGGGTVRARVAGETTTLTRKLTTSWKYLAIGLDGKVAASPARLVSLGDLNVVFERLAEDFWSNRSDKRAVWIPTLDSHWKRLLSRQQYLVTRKSHTEPKFTGQYNHTKTLGQYRCVGCGQFLFDARTKFESGTGWPSFWDPVGPTSVATETDRSHGMVRIEVKCSRCEAHLGHVFRDGPPPTGNRFCINSAALVLDSTNGQSRSQRQE